MAKKRAKHIARRTLSATASAVHVRRPNKPPRIDERGQGAVTAGTSYEALWSDLQRVVDLGRQLQRDADAELTDEASEARRDYARSHLQALRKAVRVHAPRLVAAVKRELQRGPVRKLGARVLIDSYLQSIAANNRTAYTVHRVLRLHMGRALGRWPDEHEAFMAQPMASIVARVIDTADTAACRELEKLGVRREHIRKLAEARGPRRAADAVAAWLLEVDPRSLRRVRARNEK